MRLRAVLRGPHRVELLLLAGSVVPDLADDRGPDLPASARGVRPDALRRVHIGIDPPPRPKQGLARMGWEGRPVRLRRYLS